MKNSSLPTNTNEIKKKFNTDYVPLPEDVFFTIETAHITACY